MTKYWSETQHLAARWFAENGWPYARAVGSGRQGVDVENMPGLGCEVKADRGEDLTGWLKQAAGHGAAVPFVVYRPKGYGWAKVGRWPVIVDLSTFTALLREAGFGGHDDPA